MTLRYRGSYNRGVDLGFHLGGEMTLRYRGSYNRNRGVTWGVAYKIIRKEDQEAALEHLEVREKQYDMKAYLDFFTEPTATMPAISNVLLYIASADKKLNKNYLGPASFEEIADQIVHAEGPSGPNRDYLFKLETALIQIGCEDEHVNDLADEVRRIVLKRGTAHLMKTGIH
ncbi:gamma-glutamylcyclotransferase 2-3 isoform X1 [Olea europaea subsp. europaea]|uniref:glutathione-specific gamma-glutamylcyclotransferase n=1 Tax=Olea europaea subsp. europaea TaxID=158383 RepID=A0A8S0Q526_OLEEU|nr:gamma-glutamylcyclotransferase 2-3 isoform X1 [Olea europaea subsp. europaea]